MLSRTILVIALTVFLYSCILEEEPSPEFELNVNISSVEGGTVKIDPEKNSYSQGEQVTITAQPNDFYELGEWSGDIESTENPISITFDNNNISLTVSFVLKDSDGDGVTDDLDLCPETPEGSIINSDGCKCEDNYDFPWVELSIENGIIDRESEENNVFRGLLENPSCDIAAYRIYASLSQSGNTSDTILFRTIDKFPSDLVITESEITDAFGTSSSEITKSDSVNFVAEIEGKDGSVVSYEILKDSTITIDRDKQALTFGAYFACEITSDFTGLYSLEQTEGPSDPFFGSATRFYPIETMVKAVNPIKRIWNVNFASFDVTFTAFLLCGDVVVPPTISGIGCGGPGLNWVEDPTLGPGSYDPSDDSKFTVHILENKDNGCGLPTTPETIITMTKL